ncbi:UNVERIFIED_CONTAM: hypothetical protein K2H54_068376 [Gekko kuhli]
MEHRKGSQEGGGSIQRLTHSSEGGSCLCLASNAGRRAGGGKSRGLLSEPPAPFRSPSQTSSQRWSPSRELPTAGSRSAFPEPLPLPRVSAWEAQRWPVSVSQAAGRRSSAPTASHLIRVVWLDDHTGGLVHPALLLLLHGGRRESRTLLPWAWLLRRREPRGLGKGVVGGGAVGAGGCWCLRGVLAALQGLVEPRQGLWSISGQPLLRTQRRAGGGMAGGRGRLVRFGLRLPALTRILTQPPG